MTIDENGNVCTAGSGGGGGTSSAFGAAFPADGTAAGISDGTDMQAIYDAKAITDANDGTHLLAAGAYGWNGSTWDRLKETSGALWAGGSVSDASASSGNPVPAGGVYQTTPTTYSDGNRTTLHTDQRGNINADLCDTNGTICANVKAANADAVTASTGGLATRSFGYVYNGTSWDRELEALNSMNITGTGLLVDATAAQCDDTSPTSLTENSFGNMREGCTDHSLLVGGSKAGVATALSLDSNGNLNIGQATAANLNATVVGTGTFAVQAQPTPVTSGGLTWYFVQPAASDNHAVIKNGAGQVYHIAVTNNSATINYLRLYNAGTGFNGCNSATNLVAQMAIPASTSAAGFVEDIGLGIAFSTGISICVTSGYATTDTTNATASAMSVNIGYK